MLEKRFIAVSSQVFIANGGTDGTVTVADTRLFKVKQEVTIKAISLPTLDLEIKRINSLNQMVVGPRSGSINTITDVSAYTVAAASIIFANEQKRPSIPLEEIVRAVYEEEPAVAIRTMLVDKEGNDYRDNNPLPVSLSSGDVSIGTVNAELEVQLSHKDNDPDAGDVHDSVRIGGGAHEMIVDSDNNAHVEIHGNDPAGVDRVVRTSELGALTPDGVYDVTNTKPGNIGLIASLRNASPSDSTQTQRLTSITNGAKRLLDVAIHDENGDAFSVNNPFPVTTVDSEGVEVNDSNVGASLAVNGSSDHDYVVSAGKSLKLSQVWATASGRLKVEVQVETGAATNTFVTKFVGFNSPISPNINIPIEEIVTLVAGARVRVVRTNRDNQPMDVYSTISGHEV